MAGSLALAEEYTAIALRTINLRAFDEHDCHREDAERR
jgi:hypothetical protein